MVTFNIGATENRRTYRGTMILSDSPGQHYHVLTGSFANCSNANWEEQYLQTIVAVSGQKTQERITATRQAISGRLHDLEHDSDHHAERYQIENALKALSVLEAETHQC